MNGDINMQSANLTNKKDATKTLKNQMNNPIYIITFVIVSMCALTALYDFGYQYTKNSLSKWQNIDNIKSK